MVVIVLTACPVGLRGDLTRWLLEIAPGVLWDISMLEFEIGYGRESLICSGMVVP